MHFPPPQCIQIVICTMKTVCMKKKNVLIYKWLTLGSSLRTGVFPTLLPEMSQPRGSRGAAGLIQHPGVPEMLNTDGSRAGLAANIY